MSEETQNIEVDSELDKNTSSNVESVEQQDKVEELNNTGEDNSLKYEEELIKDDDPRGVKKRISKLTAEKKKLQQELEMIKSESQNYQNTNSNESFADPFTGEQIYRPNKSDFDDAVDYIDAITNYKEKKDNIEKLKQLKYLEAKKQAELHNTFEKQKDLARQKYEDFDQIDEAVSNDAYFPISQVMANVIYESSAGADLYYWLGKNRKEADRLSQLDPIHAARELGKLENKLSSPQDIKSKAPKPLPAEGNSHGTGTNVSKMGFRELQDYLR